jgi:DNA-binding transcriptional LysR family regulator
VPQLRTLDLDLLRSFVAIAETRSFSRAAERLLRSQSTISLQLKRLEDLVGQRLMDRTPRSVTLTAEGEVLLDYAHRMLALNDEVVARVNEPQMAGVVRLGTPEDFATAHLPDVLARFAQAYPQVSLEVTCDLTLNLLDRFRAGAFDLVLVKREPGAGSAGVRVWREPLVWVAGDRAPAWDGGTLPLAVSPEPCVYRKRATEALERAGRRWRIAYACASLAGTQAAVRAGLGVTVLPKDMVPPALRLIDDGSLPDLRDTEIALLAANPLSAPAQRLQSHVVRSLEHVEAGALTAHA